MSVIFRGIITWGSMPMLVGVATLLVWRKSVRQFVYFFYYVIIGELTGVVRLCLHDRYSRIYYYTYWITDLLVAIAAFLATYELFVRRLFPRFYTVQFYRYLFPTAATVIVFLAAPAALELNQLRIIIRAIHVLGVLQVAVLVFFVSLMVFMGRRWERYEFGIALGLGIQSAALLLTSASWTQGPRIRAITTELPVVSYDIACLIWLITFLKPERHSYAATVPVSPEVLQEAKKWEETLKGSLTKKKDPD
ncbi:MAG TPA: hypothetical protein VI636_19155 [Candidatus Angelobacter sp.]